MSSVKHSTIIVNDGGLIKGSSNTIEIKDLTNTNTLITLNSSGVIDIPGSLEVNGNPMGQWIEASPSEIYYDSGNVGIGLSNPQRKLDIAGTDVKMALVSGGENELPTIFLGTPAEGLATNALKTAIIAEGGASGFDWARSKLHFCLNNNSGSGSHDPANNASITDARMTIIPSGNVGIGSTNPTEALDVNGNIKTNGYISTPSVQSDDNLYLDAGIGYDIILNNGNVGIGTADTASKKLYVLGETIIDNTGSQSGASDQGALVVTGGVGISTTADAVSPTNGGALTIAGGLAVAKKSFFGDDLDMGSNLITNLLAPIAGTDAANKAYVDAVAQGLSPKQSVRVATTTDGTLSSSFENGVTIDGVTLATGNRILIKNQTDAKENGIYIVQASGAPVRSADFDAPEDNVAGAYVFVQEGTANADSGWVCTTNGPVTFGTSNFNFTQFSSAGSVIAGTNISVSGNQVNVVAAPTFAGIVHANSGDSSGSTTSGALVVTGGAGISENLNVGGTGSITGILFATSNTSSTNITSGALVVTGGAGISQNLNVGGTGNVAGIFSATSNTSSTNTTSGALVVTGGAGISQNLFVGGTGNVAGIFSATSNTSSTNTTSGALVVTGGAGISENLFVGGTGNVAGILSVTSGTTSTNTTSGALKVTGGVGISENLNVGGTGSIAGVLSLTSGTGSSSTTTGALKVTGGVGISENLNVGGSLTVANNVDNSVSLTISGATNCDSTPVVQKKSLLRINSERLLSVVIEIDPTADTTTTSFQMTIPEKTANFANIYDITASICGITESYINLENCVIYPDTATPSNKVNISFTSAFDVSGSNLHYIHLNIRYTSD